MTVQKFDPTKVGLKYLFEAMADHIAARIDAGELSPETKLPPERDLASDYGVAVGTARRAVQELRDRGVVVTLPSKGTFVAAPEDRPNE